MQNFTTPMMMQYLAIKDEYKDCLLFFRMGDFYELFLDDALIGAKVLDITLTSRSKGRDGRIPMAGVPYHAVDPYLNKLVKAGYKVAICEQMTEPDKKGIVEREVIRVVTPGTVTDEKMLDRKENNYIISVVFDKQRTGIAIADLSTGLFQTTELETQCHTHTIVDELAKIRPAECIISPVDFNNPAILKLLRTQKDMNINCFHPWETYVKRAKGFLTSHFHISSLIGFDLEHNLLARNAAAVLLGYLKEMQKNKVSHITTITSYARQENLILDRSTITNLELFATLRDHEEEGSLINIMDHTITPMGGRMIREWIRKPLRNKDAISERHLAVEELLHAHELRTSLADTLHNITDIERTVARLATGTGNARDLIHLKMGLQKALQLRSLLEVPRSPYLKSIVKGISLQITDIVDLIDKNIIDEPPFDIKDGGLFRSGINKTLDSLRKTVNSGHSWVTKLEEEERKRTGITSLKVRYNKVFGFYIEISNANLHLIPRNYQRKQTLVNGERFITPELKQQEEIILTAEDTMNKMEYEMFQELLSEILKHTSLIQQAAQKIAQLDCIYSFADTAYTSRYCKPVMTSDGCIDISNARHPVVEQLLDKTVFVPNNVFLNNASHQLLLLTGPNMAGKSVYIRQVALIVLMAQMGSFVPADYAHISITDRIFVRSGASDMITSGLSTFMVEMVETAHILNHATKDSLVVMDEIGRGTSTYDGISIAWAIAEYLVTNRSRAPKTLFATHYHELQKLEAEYPEYIKNIHMAVEENNGEPVFLHIVMEGGASHSFGIAVAKLAGLPDQTLKRAKEILTSLETRNTHDDTHMIVKQIQKLDLNNTTPFEALQILNELKKSL